MHTWEDIVRIQEYAKCVLTGLSTIVDTRTCPFGMTPEDFKASCKQQDAAYCFDMGEAMNDVFNKRYMT